MLPIVCLLVHSGLDEPVKLHNGDRMKENNAVLEKHSEDYTVSLFIQGDVYLSALEEDKVFLTNVWKYSSQKYLGIGSTHTVERLPQEYRQLWVVMPPASEVRSRKTVNWTREDAGEMLPMRHIILDPITPEFECDEDMLVKVTARLKECADGLEPSSDVTLSSVNPVARSDRFFF